MDPQPSQTGEEAGPALFFQSILRKHLLCVRGCAKNWGPHGEGNNIIRTERKSVLRESCLLRQEILNEEMHQSLHTASVMSGGRGGAWCQDILYWGFNTKRVKQAFPGNLMLKLRGKGRVGVNAPKRNRMCTGLWQEQAWHFQRTEWPT